MKRLHTILAIAFCLLFQQNSFFAEEAFFSNESYPDFFVHIITEAKQKTQENKFKEAAFTFITENPSLSLQSPLNFKKEDFVAQSAQSQAMTDVLKKTDSSVKKIYSALSEYAALEKALSSARTPSAAQKSALNNFIALRNTIFNEGISIEKNGAFLNEANLITQDSYLFYLAHFILGFSQSPQTGIIGALDAHWAYLTADTYQSVTAITAQTERLATCIKTMWDEPQEENQAALDTARETLLQSAVPLQEIANLSARFAYTDDFPQKHYNEAFQKSVSGLFTLLEKTKTLEKNIISFYADFGNDLTASLTSNESARLAEALRKKTDVQTKTLLAKANALTKNIQNAQLSLDEQWLKTLTDITRDDIPNWSTALSSYRETYKKIETTATELQHACVQNAAYTLTNAAKQMYAEDTEKYQELMLLIPQEKEDETQHPTKLLSRLTSFQKKINSDISTLKTAQQNLSAAPSATEEYVAQANERIEKSIRDIEKVYSESKALATQARSQQREAVSAKNQIDIYYNRALSLSRREDFSQAQTNLDRAFAIYDVSIDSLKRDYDVLTETYTKLTVLKQQVAEGQKPVLIQEIRGLKNTAKSAYYAGEFEQAGDILNEADITRENWSRFMDVTLESDEELERLKTMVNTALAIREGRELSVHNALYPEMSQLLSISNQYYEQGMSLIENGERERARYILMQAKDKLNELKIVYPRNQQANLLSLRIDQILDKAEFNKSFAQKFNELQKIDYTNPDTTAQLGYADLQDLYELNPSYPELEDFIYQVEIDLGIRQKPIDNSALEEAEALAKEAQEKLLAAGRDNIQLENAKTTANRALVLNPDNDLAVAVLDEIALRTGAQAAVVLSANDEEKYQKAITYLQSGNIVAANANLQELLQTPANRRSAKILKLQNRIEGMLQ